MTGPAERSSRFSDDCPGARATRKTSTDHETWSSRLGRDVRAIELDPLTQLVAADPDAPWKLADRQRDTAEPFTRSSRPMAVKPGVRMERRSRPNACRGVTFDIGSAANELQAPGPDRLVRSQARRLVRDCGGNASRADRKDGRLRGVGRRIDEGKVLGLGVGLGHNLAAEGGLFALVRGERDRLCR